MDLLKNRMTRTDAYTIYISNITVTTALSCGILNASYKTLLDPAHHFPSGWWSIPRYTGYYGTERSLYTGQGPQQPCLRNMRDLHGRYIYPVFNRLRDKKVECLIAFATRRLLSIPENGTGSRGGWIRWSPRFRDRHLVHSKKRLNWLSPNHDLTGNDPIHWTRKLLPRSCAEHDLNGATLTRHDTTRQIPEDWLANLDHRRLRHFQATTWLPREHRHTYPPNWRFRLRYRWLPLHGDQWHGDTILKQSPRGKEGYQRERVLRDLL